MKKVLITGANSYIGTSVEKYIIERYPDECVFDTVDLIDGAWREMSFSGYDCVFHVAGIAHQKETSDNAQSYYAINRDLAVEVAKKAQVDGVNQFIFLSSMSVYGLLKGRITADTTPMPKSNYGKSKLQAEEQIQQLATDEFKICILRPPMIYGKDCKGNYLTLRKLALKLKIFPYVKNERSMLYIENLCEFVRFMILNDESGIFFPQNNEYTNTSQMVKYIATAHNKKICIVHGFGWAVKALGLFTGLVKKAFGTLTYDKTMGEYKQEYCVIDLKNSVCKSESELKL